MKTHQEELSDITRYIDTMRHLRIEDHQREYDKYLDQIRRFHTLDGSTRILEIGIGTGWFPVLSKMNGLQVKGLEISPQLIDYAREFGRANGVEIDVDLGNAEENDLGSEQWDVILAHSVFEHIEHWEKAAERIHRALLPGGLFCFSSTNKFSFTSGEYDFPLYGWLPDQWRYRLRMWRQGDDIMKLGIDFNQFRYPLLRRTFARIGYSKIYDRVEMSRPEEASTPFRGSISRLAKTSPIMKKLVLTFADATIFCCVK